MRKYLRLEILMVLAILAAGRSAAAWNATGHEAVAIIAWQNLTPAARTKVTEILRQHPDYVALLTRDTTPQGDPRDLEAFLTASYWPDLVRTPGRPQYKYNHPVWHYADYPFTLDANLKPESPVVAWKPDTDPANAIQAYQKCLAELKNEALPAADRAIAMAWVLHLVGDIHQPLHATSFFSAQYPTGDRGGNSMMVRANGKATNLHALWDDLEGSNQTQIAAQLTAERLIKAYPRKELEEKIAEMSFDAWAKESFAQAKETVYLGGKLSAAPSDEYNKDKSIPVPDVPIGYMAAAMILADQKVVLAGYRLANQLNQIFDAAALR